MNHYQIAIIGGGPAGYTAAAKAGKSNQKVVLFEKNKLGGVCLNEGCIPTKTLLYSAKLFDYTKDSNKYAVTVNEANFDLKKIIARKNKVVRKLVLGVKAKVTEANVEIIEGEATLKNSTTIVCNEQEYTFDKLIVCTGSSTFIPPIKGVDTIEYWTHKEALDSKELPEDLTVVGGGVIGMEFASFFNSLGVKVKVVEMQDEILPGFDKEAVENLRSEYAKKGIEFLLSTKVKEFSKVENQINILLEKDGEDLTITTHKVLLSVGRKANTQGIGLDKIGLSQNERGLFIVDDKLQSSNKNIFICGDANGKSLLAHTAIREAEVAVNTILNVNDTMSYDAIAGIVYTNPEIAGVGKTEEQLATEGTSYEKRVIPMTFSGRFVAENEGLNGLCKLLYHKETHKILGVHLVGNPASEIITLASMAITYKMTVSDWEKLVFPHPTVGEIFKDVL